MTNAGYPITESSIKKWFMKEPIIPDFKNMIGIAKVFKIGCERSYNAKPFF